MTIRKSFTKKMLCLYQRYSIAFLFSEMVVLYRKIGEVST